MLRKERVKTKGRREEASFLPSLRIPAALLLAAGLLYVLSVRVPGFAPLWRRTVYRAAVEGLGRVSGLVPVPLSELLLYVLILLLLRALVCLARSVRAGGFFRELLKMFSGCLRTASLLLFLYMAFCGVNYRAPAFSEEAGLETGKSSTEELYALCEELAEGVNRSAAAAELWNDTAASPPAAWTGREGQASLRKLAREYPGLSGFYPYPKPLICPRILSAQQLTGIYLPFFIEACWNGEMPVYNRPFTVCHELSHLRGYMREDEANFIAFLACIGSEDRYFNYAGYLSGWVYAGNELYKADRKRFDELYGRLCERARADLEYNNAFWDRFEGKAAETQERVNDAYLKSMGQEQGVRSYGRMVDLMLALRRKKE